METGGVGDARASLLEFLNTAEGSSNSIAITEVFLESCHEGREVSKEVRSSFMHSSKAMTAESLR